MQIARTFSWNVLPSPLKHALNSLFDAVLQGWESDGPPAVLDVMAQSTSIQRIQRLIDSVPLTNLLLTLLSTSYRKVGAGVQRANFCGWTASTTCHPHGEFSLYKLWLCWEEFRILLSAALNLGLSLSVFQSCKLDELVLVKFFCQFSDMCEFREQMKRLYTKCYVRAVPQSVAYKLFVSNHPV